MFSPAVVAVVGTSIASWLDVTTINSFPTAAKLLLVAQLLPVKALPPSKLKNCLGRCLVAERPQSVHPLPPARITGINGLSRLLSLRLKAKSARSSLYGKNNG